MLPPVDRPLTDLCPADRAHRAECAPLSPHPDRGARVEESGADPLHVHHGRLTGENGRRLPQLAPQRRQPTPQIAHQQHRDRNRARYQQTPQGNPHAVSLGRAA